MRFPKFLNSFFVAIFVFSTLASSTNEYLRDLKAITTFLGDVFSIKEFQGYYDYEASIIYKDLLNLVINEIGMKSELENVINQQVLSELSELFKAYSTLLKNNSMRSEIIKRKNIASNLKSAILSLTCTQKGLAETNYTKTILFPCGYSNPSKGHSIQCEIFKTDDTNFTFVVYNTGDGIQYHPPKSIGPRHYRQSAIVFDGIKKNDIINDHFLTSLLEPYTITCRDGSSQYSSDILYSAILGNRFSGNLKSNVSNIDYIQPQLAGTCVFSSMHAFVRTKLQLNHPNQPLIFDLVYFILGLLFMEYYIDHGTMDLEFSEDHGFANTGYQIAQRVFLLLDKFVSYLAWMIGKLEGKNEEFFASGSSNIGNSIHWRDALLLMNHHVKNTPILRLGLLQSLYSDRLATLDSKTKAKYYNYEFNSYNQISRFEAMNIKIDYGWKNSIKTISTNHLFNTSNLVNNNRISYLRLVNNSEKITIDTIKSTLLYSQQMINWFNNHIEKVVTFQSEFVRGLSLDVNRYDTSNGITVIINELSNLFYEIIQNASLTRAGCSFYDIVIALYRLYFILFKLSSIADPLITQHLCIPNSMFEKILNHENIANLPYNSHLIQEFKTLKAEIDKFSSLQGLNCAQNAYRYTEIAQELTYGFPLDKSYTWRWNDECISSYSMARIRRVNQTLAEHLRSNGVTSDLDISMKLLIDNCKNVGIRFNQGSNPSAFDAPKYMIYILQMMMVIKNWNNPQLKSINFGKIPSNAFPSQEFYELRDLAFAFHCFIQRDQGYLKEILGKSVLKSQIIEIDLYYSEKYSWHSVSVDVDHKYALKYLSDYKSKPLPSQWQTTLISPIDSEMSIIRPFDDNYFSNTATDENRFIINNQMDLSTRPIFETNLGTFSKQSSLVNVLHHAIETPHCMQDASCKLLLVHSLCNQYSGHIFVSESLHRYDSFFAYVSMQQKKYEISHDMEPLIFAICLEIRVSSMMIEHHDKFKDLLNTQFTEFFGKLSHLKILLDTLDNFVLNIDQRNTLNLCMAYSVAMLVIIDSLSYDVIKSNSMMLEYGLLSHFLYHFLSKNSLAGLSDETIKHQCDRASIRLFSCKESFKYINNVTNTAWNILFDYKYQISIDNIIPNSIIGVIYYNISSINANVKIDIISGSIGINSTSDKSGLYGIFTDNEFMSFVYKNKLIRNVTYYYDPTRSSDKYYKFAVGNSINNGYYILYFEHQSNQWNLYRYYDNLIYQSVSVQSFIDNMKLGSLYDLGLNPYQSTYTIWAISISNRIEFMIGILDEIDGETPVIKLNATDKLSLYPISSDIYHNISCKMLKFLISKKPSEIIDSTSTEYRDIPKKLGQLMLFSNGYRILNLSTSLTFAIILFPYFHDHNGRIMMIQYEDGNVFYQNNQSIIVSYDQYDNISESRIKNTATSFKRNLIPHLLVNTLSSYLLLIPSITPKLLYSEIEIPTLTIQVHEMNISSDGTINCKTRFDYIFISYILLAFDLPMMAIDYIKQIHLAEPFKDIESEYMIYIINLPINDPDCIYARMIILYLLHSNNHWFIGNQIKFEYPNDLIKRFFATAHLIPDKMMRWSTMNGDKEFGILGSMDILHIYDTMMNHDFNNGRNNTKYIISPLNNPTSNDPCFFNINLNSNPQLRLMDLYNKINQSSKYNDDFMFSIHHIFPTEDEFIDIIHYVYLQRINNIDNWNSFRSDMKLLLSEMAFTKFPGYAILVNQLLSDRRVDLCKFFETAKVSDCYSENARDAISMIENNVRYSTFKECKPQYNVINTLDPYTPNIQRSNRVISRHVDIVDYTSIMNNITGLLMHPSSIKSRENVDKVKIKLLEFKKPIDTLLNELNDIASLDKIHKIASSRIIAIDDLVHLFIYQNNQVYSNRFNHSSNDILKIISKFLIASSFESQLDRYAKELSRLSSVLPNFESFAINSEYPFIPFNFGFNLNEYPQLLLFEYYSKLSIRKDQADNIHQFITRLHDNQPLILQKMMASGKTFTLTPNLAMLIPTIFNKFPLLLSPAPLYLQNTIDIGSKTWKFFGQRSHVLTCERSRRQIEPSVLNWIKYNIIETKSHMGYFITFPETVQCFQNIHSELMMNDGYKENESFIILNDILVLFQNQSIMLMDEADTVMDPIHELNFPYRDKLDIDMLMIKFISLMFNSSSECPERGTVERSTYDINVIPYMSKHAISIISSNPVWSTLFDITITSNTNQSTILTDFFNRTGSLYNHLVNDPSSNEPLVRLFQFIHQDLYQIWQKVPDVRYGPSMKYKNQLFSIPYGGANQPKEGSLFSDYWKIIYFTFEYYYRTPIGHDHIKSFMISQRNDILAEMERYQFNIRLLDTHAYQLVYKLLNFKIRNDLQITDHDIAIVSATLSRYQARKFSFLAHIAFNDLIVYKSQISNVPLNIPTFSSNHIGYTGTIDNPYIFYNPNTSYALDLRAGYSITNSIKSRLSTSNMKLIVISKEPVGNEASLDIILSELRICDYQSLYDIGAIFKSFKNNQIAANILRHCNSSISSVIYYEDKKLTKMILSDYPQIEDFSRWKEDDIEKDSESLKTSFTYLDQSHTIGSDVAAWSKAKGLFTVSLFDTEKHILQGIMRMRRYTSKQQNIDQRLDMVITKYFASLLLRTTGACNYSIVLDYAKNNTDKKIKQENSAISIQRVEVETFKHIRNMTMCNITDEISGKIFLKDSIPVPTISKSRIIDKMNQRQQVLLNMIDNDDARKSIIKKFQAIPRLIEMDMHENVQDEQEQEQIQEQEQEQEQEQIQEHIAEMKLYSGNIYKVKSHNSYNMHEYIHNLDRNGTSIYEKLSNLIQMNPNQKEYSKYIDENLYISKDFVLIFESENQKHWNTKNESNQIHIFDSLSKHPYQLLILKNSSNEYRVIFTSLYEIHQLQIENDYRFGYSAWIFNPIATASSNSDIKGLTHAIENNQKLQSTLVSAMIFSGSTIALFSPTWSNYTVNYLKPFQNDSLLDKYYRTILSEYRLRIDFSKHNNPILSLRSALKKHIKLVSLDDNRSISTNIDDNDQQNDALDDQWIMEELNSMKSANRTSYKKGPKKSIIYNLFDKSANHNFKNNESENDKQPDNDNDKHKGDSTISYNTGIGAICMIAVYNILLLI